MVYLFQIPHSKYVPNLSFMGIKLLPYTCITLSAFKSFPYALSTFLSWLYIFCYSGAIIIFYIYFMNVERLREIIWFNNMANKRWNQDFNLHLLTQKSIFTHLPLYLNKQAVTFSLFFLKSSESINLGKIAFGNGDLAQILGRGAIYGIISNKEWFKN